jgi:hypothetical protein
MEMRIGIQGVSETLHKRHGATSRLVQTERVASAPLQFRRTTRE